MKTAIDRVGRAAGKLTASLSLNLLKTIAGSDRYLAADSPAGALARGRIFQLSGYFEDAADSYSAAMQSEKHADEAAARLAIVQLSTRRPEQALATATALASRNPKYEFKEMTSNQRISALTVLGDALTLNGRLDDAIDAYKRARSTSPKDAMAAGRLAQAYLAKGDTKKAVALAGDVGRNPRFRRLAALLEAGRQNPSVFPGAGVDTMVSFVINTVGGRPILVDDKPMVAPVITGDEWCADIP